MATKKRKKMGSGWMKISTPQDLRAALQRMLNKILMSRSPLEHVGAFAQLSNAWTNSFRTEIELIEVKELEKRLSELEDLRRYQEAKETEGLAEMDRARRELSELMKQWR
jgi:hypothetical protein